MEAPCTWLPGGPNRQPSAIRWRTASSSDPTVRTMGKEPRRGDPGPATPGGVGRLTDHTSAGGQALCHRLGLPEPEDPFPLTNTTAQHHRAVAHDGRTGQ